MNKVKTGVIGCGHISDVYYENMINLFDILDVKSCAARNLDHAKQKGQKNSIEAVSVEEMMNDSDIELIVNLTPAPAHYGLIRQALEAGKHVYTEKIITPTLSEALELQSLAKEKGLRLGCSPDTFLGAAIQTAKQAVDQGLIGTPVSCHGAVNRELGFILSQESFMSAPGGGIGFDVGIYYLTALLSILGPVKEASGFTDNTCPERTIENPASSDFGKTFRVENENVMVATLKFQNDVYGTLNFNSNSIWPQNPILTIYGTEGILHLANPDKFNGKVLLQKRGCEMGVELPITHGFAQNCRGVGVAEMAWAMRKSRPHRAHFDMGCHALEVFEAIEKSGQTGKRYSMMTTFDIPKKLPEGYIEAYFQKNQEIALIK